jgi:hypothetical protein
MNRIIDNITEKFKSIWPSSLPVSTASTVSTTPVVSTASVAPTPLPIQEKQFVEGYHMSSDITNDKTLVLVKHSDKFWKTEWFDNSAMAYRAPVLPLNELFAKHN